MDIKVVQNCINTIAIKRWGLLGIKKQQLAAQQSQK